MDTTHIETSVAQPSKRRWALIGASGLVVAAAIAFAAPFGAAQARPGHGGFGGPMMGDDGGDPAVAERRIDGRVQMMLADIDATAEQRSKIGTILKGARNDLVASHQRLRDGHLKTLDLLAAPTIDRAALERQRIEQTQLHDTVSRRMLQAMADAAEVLTPQQRAKLAEQQRARMERRHGRPAN